MIPFFSRMFPGTNLQDLNLDWIVRRIMELSKGIIAPWINAQNQHWMVYDTAAETFVDSGVSAAGEGTGPQGEPGRSPVIGSNGNWYTWDTTTQAYTDTGTHAEGPEGPAGPEGPRAGNNLLDNWYFINPVNQRGLSAWQNAGDYTVDRWKLTSGSASLGASGLTLNGTLVQIRETAIGQPVVCSALLSDGSMITPTYDDSTKTFTLTATGQTIKAVKLELGSEQTLAHMESNIWVLNEIPDYGQELAKCQRFQVQVFEGSYMVGVITSDASGVLITFPLPVPMRVGARIESAFTANVYGDVSSIVAYLDAATSLNVQGNQTTVRANLTSTDPANANKFVQIVPAQNNIIYSNL